MSRQPKLDPGKQILIAGLDQSSGDELLKIVKSLGFEGDTVPSIEDMIQLVETVPVNLIVLSAGKIKSDLTRSVQSLRKSAPLSVFVLVHSEHSRQTLPHVYSSFSEEEIVSDPIKCARTIAQAMEKQHLSERNTALFRALMAKEEKLKVANSELAIRRSENRMLNDMLSHASPAQSVEATEQDRVDSTADEVEKLTSSLQELVEELGAEFTQALDSMMFYASQVLHQSEGAEEGLALSRWIESEVARLKESYDVTIQKYYAKTMDDLDDQV